MIETAFAGTFILFVFMGDTPQLPGLPFSTHQDCANALRVAGSMLNPGGRAYCFRERDGVVTDKVQTGGPPIGWPTPLPPCVGIDSAGNYITIPCGP